MSSIDLKHVGMIYLNQTIVQKMYKHIHLQKDKHTHKQTHKHKQKHKHIYQLTYTNTNKKEV